MQTLVKTTLVNPVVTTQHKSRYQFYQQGPKTLKDLVVLRAAATSEEGSGQQQFEEYKVLALEKFQEYKEKAVDAWRDSENKPLVVLLGFGSLLALWSANSVLDSVEKVPFLGDLMKLVGVCVTGFYAYKYISSDDERTKIQNEIDTIKINIVGK
eukprot:TRINITY_DN2446_c0_g1_i2.p2 TRINITY_DN2446_c0_g1~~TRINITY_DN2446_c0_g1_i2.p2  ORF type:complete len:179 (+),score=11.55 TRINITY_DN2446_c0_g1_i2:75-539(+)